MRDSPDLAENESNNSSKYSTNNSKLKKIKKKRDTEISTEKSQARVGSIR